MSTSINVWLGPEGMQAAQAEADKRGVPLREFCRRAIFFEADYSPAKLGGEVRVELGVLGVLRKGLRVRGHLCLPAPW